MINYNEISLKLNPGVILKIRDILKEKNDNRILLYNSLKELEIKPKLILNQIHNDFEK